MKLDVPLKILQVVPIILLACFIFTSAYDTYMYFEKYQYLSSPLYLYLLRRVVMFLIPSLLLIVVRAGVSKPTDAKNKSVL